MASVSPGHPAPQSSPAVADLKIERRQFFVPPLLRDPPEASDIDLLSAARDFIREASRDQPPQSTIWEGEIGQSGLAQLESALSSSDFVTAHHLLENFWVLDKGRIGGTYLKFDTGLLKRRVFYNWTRSLLERFRLGDDCDAEEVCVVSPVGNPAGFSTASGIVNPISIRHAYDARALARLSDGGAVLEIGGAHGGLGAKIIRTGAYARYIDCDLPIMLCVAYYFLSKTFPDRKIVFLPPEGEGKAARKALDGCDVLLVSAHMSGVLAEIDYDGVFNSYSFSEMTLPIVTDYVRAIEASGAKFVLHENYSGYGKPHPHLVPAREFPFKAFRLVSSGFTLDAKNLDCQRYLLMR